MCAIGVFLGSYRGYVSEKGERLSDRHLALIAGIAAASVAIFPTDGFRGYPASFSLVGFIHVASASVFLLILGIFSYFRFTRSKDAPEKQPLAKKRRNRIYRYCGGVIFACLGLIACLKILGHYDIYTPPLDTWLFWLERIAVWAFGISWLVKGETLEDVGNFFTTKS
jgi:hypothetical protein